MKCAVFLFALLALATAEPPVRFRSRAAGFGVQRPNGRFARLEEQPQPPAPEEPATGYQYPKPTPGGYHYPKPEQAFPPPGETGPTTEAAQPETTTVSAEPEPTTTEGALPPPATTTTTPDLEDYDEGSGTEAPIASEQLRQRPQQFSGPSPIRYTLGQRQKLQQLQQQQQQQYLLNQRLEQPSLATASVDEAPRPVYLINLPESTLQQLILLNSAQQQLQPQPYQIQLLPQQPTTVLLSELDYVYKKK